MARRHTHFVIKAGDQYVREVGDDFCFMVSDIAKAHQFTTKRTVETIAARLHGRMGEELEVSVMLCQFERVVTFRRKKNLPSPREKAQRWKELAREPKE